MRERRLDAAVARHAQSGGAVLGICGGLQMLGEALIDPHGIDGNAPGLGLLPLVTRFERDKQVRPCTATFETVLPPGPWQALAGLPVQGYEIHHGQTVQHPAMAARGDVAWPVLQGGLGWCNPQGHVLGVVVHGLFENAALVRALFGDGPGGSFRPGGGNTPGPHQQLHPVFEGLADAVEAHFLPGFLENWIK